MKMNTFEKWDIKPKKIINSFLVLELVFILYQYHTKSVQIQKKILVNWNPIKDSQETGQSFQESENFQGNLFHDVWYCSVGEGQWITMQILKIKHQRILKEKKRKKQTVVLGKSTKIKFNNSSQLAFKDLLWARGLIGFYCCI